MRLAAADEVFIPLAAALLRTAWFEQTAGDDSPRLQADQSPIESNRRDRLHV